MTTECGQVRNQIPQALLGDLGPEDLQRLTSHLAECLGCRQEEQLYRHTFEQLHSAGDVPVPKHFFVYETAHRQSPWGLFRGMSLAWQGTLASAFILVVLTGALSAARFQCRVENGVIILSFGSSPARVPVQQTPAIDAAALEARILQAVEKRSREETLDWVRTLRDEIAQGNQQLDQRQRALFETALLNLETRMTANVTETAEALQARTERSLGDIYNNINLQRERDVNAFNDRITKMALDDETRNNQTDIILDALLQAAELRLRQQ